MASTLFQQPQQQQGGNLFGNPTASPGGGGGGLFQQPAGGQTALFQQQQPQQQQQQPGGLFGQQQQQPLFGVQQGATQQQPNLLGQQQPNLLGNPQQQPVAPVVAQPTQQSAAAQAAQEQKLIQQYRDAQKKGQVKIHSHNSKSREEDMILLRKRLEELNNRVRNDFEKGFSIAKSNEQMNRDVHHLLNQNLNTLGVSLNHINYVNDMLQRLSENIKSKQESRTKYSVPSLFKVGDLHCITLNQLQQLHANAVLNSTSYQQHQMSNVHSQFLDQLKSRRQNYRGSGTSCDIRSNTRMIDSSHKFDRSDQLIQGVFAKMEDQILTYNRIRIEQNQIPTAAQLNILEQIFDTMMKSTSHLQKEFLLLKFQFHNYPMVRAQISENKQLILDNTVKFLENQFQVDAFDIYSLNRKFLQTYEPQMKNYVIPNLNGIYPSGVLLVLARMGKTDLARKLFDGWGKPDHPLVKEVHTYLRYADKPMYTYSEVRVIYEGKLTSTRIDPILKQLYLILFQISEIEDVFESVHFTKDKDILLWLTLKTCRIETQNKMIYEEGEAEQLYINLTLDELQASIPLQSNQGYLLDLQLQRYNHALKLLGQRTDYVQQYPHEYAMLLIILKDVGLITEYEFKERNAETQAIHQLVSHLFVTKPLLASVTAQLGVQDPTSRVQRLEFQRLLSTNFVRSKTVQLLFTDEKFKQQFQEQVFERMAVKDLFQEQLHIQFKRFISSIEKASTKPQLFEALEQLNQELDELSVYLKDIQKQQRDTSLMELCYLANETFYMLFYCETLLFQILQHKFKTHFADPEILKIWKQLKYPVAKELHFFLRILIQDFFNQRVAEKMKKLHNYLRVVEVFSQVLLFVKHGQVQLDPILTVMENLSLPETAPEFRIERKDDTIFQLLWIVMELFQRNRARTDELKHIIKCIKSRLRNGSAYLDVHLPLIMGQEVDIPLLPLVSEYKQILLVKYGS